MENSSAALARPSTVTWTSARCHVRRGSLLVLLSLAVHLGCSETIVVAWEVARSEAIVDPSDASPAPALDLLDSGVVSADPPIPDASTDDDEEEMEMPFDND